MNLAKIYKPQKQFDFLLVPEYQLILKNNNVCGFLDNFLQYFFVQEEINLYVFM